MSGNNRSKLYSGQYRGKKVVVRVKRLFAFGLALVLVRVAGPAVIDWTTSDDDKSLDNMKTYGSVYDANKAQIEEILKENPHILSDVFMDTYTVKSGDTLSGIAEDCGNTINRICSLNNIESDAIIRIGDELNVEVIKPKEETDKKMAALESYFHEYVFESEVAKLARTNASDNKDGAITYRSIIYGSPKSASSIDPNSLYGRFFNAYMRFHESTEKTDETKRQYVEELLAIEKDAVAQLNYGGIATNIIPFDTYYIYLENKTTAYDQLQAGNRSVYS